MAAQDWKLNESTKLLEKCLTIAGFNWRLTKITDKSYTLDNYNGTIFNGTLVAIDAEIKRLEDKVKPDENPDYSHCRGEFPRVTMTRRKFTPSRDVQAFLDAAEAYFQAVAIVGTEKNNGGVNMLLAEVHKKAHRCKQAAMRSQLPDQETRKAANIKLNEDATKRLKKFEETDRQVGPDDIYSGYNVITDILDVRRSLVLSHREFKVRYLGGTEKWIPEYAVKGPQDKISAALAALSDTPMKDELDKLREKLAQVDPKDVWKLPLNERREWVIMQLKKHWLKERLSRNVISNDPTPPTSPASNPVERAA